ncbi:Ent-kaurene oxidase [Linum grandiflorum]
MEPSSIVAALSSLQPAALVAAVMGGLIFALYCMKNLILDQKTTKSNLPRVPVVPGLPIIGNLLPLREKKPHKTFVKWAESYGPIYSIRTGSTSIVVLNSTDIVKEAMVTRFSSISTRNLPKALSLLTHDKSIVAMSDYDDFHRTAKRHLLANILSPTAQKKHHAGRVTLLDNVASELRAHVKANPGQAFNFRNIFEHELFSLSMRQAIGKEVESIYVEEFGTRVSREEMFKILILDLLEGCIEVDWREFFPYLRWVPNPSFEKKIKQIHFRRDAVMNALIRQQKERFSSGEVLDCFFDHLMSEAKTLTDDQIKMLIWEQLVESADTVLVVTEWAMYELAKNPKCQEKLFQEIRGECGSEELSEQHLSKLPYLVSIFHETLRRHTPVPVIPLRFVDEDIELGGYHIPARTEIAINLYACNMDEKQWENPEEWLPERFLSGGSDPMELRKTMAFGSGKRACAGALQAMLITCTSIGRMIQEFEWSLEAGEDDDEDTKKHRSNKAIMIDNIAAHLQAHAEANPGQAVNFRLIFESELFGLSMRQAIGKEVESIYVKELGTRVSKEEIFKILVLDPLDGVIDLDWREFFPYLSWIPNRGFEKKIQQMHFRRDAVLIALVKEQKERIASGEVIDCYIDHLLSEAENLTDLQIRMLIWEVIIAASDTVLVATEWAMYQLAKNQESQERLYQQIRSECGSETVSEQHLSKLTYLSAIFHETLRRHTPVPVIALRHVAEDTELGGYHVPAGTDIAINLYGCNMDEKQWENPEEWLPERFLNGGSESTELHKTMAFGRGKRACTGALQAMLIACTSIGRMVQQFEWSLGEGEEGNEDTVVLTSRKLEPLYAIIKPRC